MTPHRLGSLAARGTPTDPRKWEVVPKDRSPGLWIKAPGCLPKAFASVAASRSLPTHSCATAPDSHRLPLVRELFSCASYYGVS